MLYTCVKEHNNNMQHRLYKFINSYNLCLHTSNVQAKDSSYCSNAALFTIKIGYEKLVDNRYEKYYIMLGSDFNSHASLSYSNFV